MQSWTAKTDRWFEENKQVFKRFCHMAIGLKNIGMFRSAKYIVENLRFTRLAINSKPYKIDNSFTADMARRAMQEHPKLRGYFKIRKRGWE